MRVAIIAFNNLKFSPYIFRYVEMLKKNHAQIDLIYPNRNKIDEEFNDGKLIEVKWNSKKNKIINFLSFKKQVSKILRSESYDFVIVLTTFPAVLLSVFLTRRYRGKYLIDIRDYTHEGNALYYFLEKKVLKHATIRAISAPGFKNFLPDNEYSVFQNISPEYFSGRKSFIRKNDKKIVIGYVGSIGYKNQCINLIDLVKNDERFCFYFYGSETGDKTIYNYVNNCNCDRIKCFGPYMPSEKGKIIEELDVMFNIYGNDRPLVRYALSNKLYDSMYFKKPLLVSPETDMQRQAQNFSYAIDWETTTSLDDLYNWYMNIDPKEYEEFADAYIKKALEGNQAFEIMVTKILKA